MQDSHQGQGNGLDLVGGALKAGEVRMGSLDSQREGNGGEGSWVACKPQRAVSQSTGLETLGPATAQLSCQICPLLALPSTKRPQAWGALILSPTTHYTARGPCLPAPRQHLRSSLGHRCLFTLMGEQGWGAVLRESSLSETLPPRDHFPQRRSRRTVRPGSAGWGR